MLSSAFVSLLALGSVWSRDAIRTRAMPTISNSLVNLGKMDITFHINGGKENDIPLNDQFIPFTNPKPLNPPPTIDECMCNSLRNNFKDNIFGGASEMFNKILTSNDFLNFNNPTAGPQCCESHEENIITFELGPTRKPAGNLLKPIVPFQPYQQNMPSIIFDSFLPKKLPFPQTNSLKPKAIEIFLFPKNKDGKKPWLSSIASLPKKTVKKDIKIVGDKDNKFEEVKLETVDKLKPTDNLKYETVEPVTEKKEKEIGIKDQEDYNKSEVKEELQKEEVSNVSYTNSV